MLPTSQPNANPTPNPTPNPTSQPTLPTQQPTPVPLGTPTSQPTATSRPTHSAAPTTAAPISANPIDVQFLPVEYLDFGSTRKEILFLATFEEELFVNYSCSATPYATVFVPCCNNARRDPTIPCYSPSQTCIDGDSLSLLSQPFANYTDIQRFQLKISNFQSDCTLALSVLSNRGSVGIDVRMGNFSVFETLQYRSAGLCCSQLTSIFRSRNPESDWDGSVEIVVKTFLFIETTTASTFDLVIEPDTTKLPYRRFSNLAQISHKFPDSTLVNCDSATCDFRLLPSPSPLYDFYSRPLVDTDLAFNFSIAWSLTIESKDIITCEVFRSYNWDFVLGSLDGCRIQFLNVYNGDGVLLTDWYSSQQVPLPSRACKSDVIGSYVSDLDDLINAYEVYNTGDDLDAIQWRFNVALSPTLHLDFINCMSYVKNYLLLPTITAVENKTQSCLEIVGSSAYQNNPCCNNLAPGCCAKVATPVWGYQPNMVHVQFECSERDNACVMSTLKNFVDADRLCSSEASQDYIDFEKIFDECRQYYEKQSCLVDDDCAFVPGSHCVHPNSMSTIYSRQSFVGVRGVCSIPCRTDNDCLDGQCVQSGNLRFCYSPNQVNYADALGTCLVETLVKNPNFDLSGFLDRMNMSLANYQMDDLISSFVSRLSTPGVLQQETDTNQFSTNTTAETCNWHKCDSTSEPTMGTISECTSDLCDSNFRGPDLCGISQSDSIMTEISQNDYCVLLPLPSRQPVQSRMTLIQTYEKECLNYGTWDNSTLLCYINQTDRDGCLPAQFCDQTSIPLQEYSYFTGNMAGAILSEGVVCPARCYFPNVTDARTCQLLRVPSYWTPYGTCEVQSENFGECTAGYGGTFWRGSIFLSRQFDTPDKCNAFCQGSPSVKTKVMCTKTDRKHCSLPFCPECNQSSCESRGCCNAFPGCYFPLDVNGECSDASLAQKVFQTASVLTQRKDYYQWTPEGCTFRMPSLAYLLSSKATCEKYGGHHRSYQDWRAMTKSDCESLVTNCQLPGTPAIASSFHSFANCKQCGGQITSAFQWTQGEWILNTDDSWVDLSWTRRDMIPLNPVVSVIEKENFLKFFNYYLTEQMFSLGFQRLLCYQNKVGFTDKLSCLCPGESGSTEVCEGCIYSEIQFGSFRLCGRRRESFEGNISGARISVTGNDTLVLPRCVELTISFIDSSPYNLVKATVYSKNFTSIVKRKKRQEESRKRSGRLFSTHVVDNFTQIGVFFNENGQEAGFLAGDGLYLSTASKVNMTSPNDNISVCYNLGDLAIDLSLYPIEIRWIGLGIIRADKNGLTGSVQFPDNFANLVLITNASVVCLPYYAGYAYFPFVFRDNIHISYVQTIASQNLAMILVGIFLYTAVFICVVIFLVLRLSDEGFTFDDVKDTSGYNYNQLTIFACVVLGEIVLFLRFVYFCYLASDPRDELASLFFLEIPSFIVITCSFVLIFQQVYTHDPFEDDNGCKCNRWCCLVQLKWLVAFSIFMNTMTLMAYLITAFGRMGLVIAPNYALTTSASIAATLWFFLWVGSNVVCLIWFGIFTVIHISKYLSGSNKIIKTKKEILTLLSILLYSILVFIGHTAILMRTFLFFELWTLAQVTVLGLLWLCDLSPLIFLCCLYYWRIEKSASDEKGAEEVILNERQEKQNKKDTENEPNKPAKGAGMFFQKKKSFDRERKDDEIELCDMRDAVPKSASKLHMRLKKKMSLKNLGEETVQEAAALATHDDPPSYLPPPFVGNPTLPNDENDTDAHSKSVSRSHVNLGSSIAI